MDESRSLTRMAFENQSVFGDESETATSAVLGRGRRVPGDDACPEPSAAASSSQWASTQVAPKGLEGCLSILSSDEPCGGQSKEGRGSRKTNKGSTPSVATGMAQQPVGKPRAPIRNPNKGTSGNLKSHDGGVHRDKRASAGVHPQWGAASANDVAPSSAVHRHHGRDGGAPLPLGACPTPPTAPQSTGGVCSHHHRTRSPTMGLYPLYRAEVSAAALRALPVPLPSASSVSSQQELPSDDTVDMPQDYNVYNSTVFNAAFISSLNPSSPCVGVISPVRPATPQEDGLTDHLLDSDDDDSQVCQHSAPSPWPAIQRGSERRA
jgi:hypothetical protein